ncbi:hypothetical protein [Zymomonas sp.]|uniref:hypothetical protein n=1 Tax=Zymomonas sp. TaxID=2068624 RepID=UPI0025E2D930|nr:hypothetical protein [Zymomonas sp.]MCA1956668.1 hypothetical protein [Zymomonas sp.]
MAPSPAAEAINAIITAPRQPSMVGMLWKIPRRATEVRTCSILGPGMEQIIKTMPQNTNQLCQFMADPFKIYNE